MSRREQRIRLSETEKRLCETLKNEKYGNDTVAMGAVISDAVRAALADIADRDGGADSDDDEIIL